MAQGRYAPRGETNRLCKLKAKATVQENDEIREAAHRTGVTVSHFLIQTATQKAQQILQAEGGAQ